MYSGSMVGAGATPFAVMGYVIACQVPDREVGSQVELNPKLLAFIIGEPESKIESAIEFLCSPDPNSRSEEEGGRRLIRLSQFSFRVVNGAKYRAIRDEERRRAQNRENKRKSRAKAKGKPLPGESGYEQSLNSGDDEAAEHKLDNQPYRKED